MQVMAQLTQVEGIEIPTSASVGRPGHGAPADGVTLEGSGAAT